MTVRAVAPGMLAASLLVAATLPAQAGADDDYRDPYELPDAPSPPTLPDLTHRALALSLESTWASIHGKAEPGAPDPGRSFGWNERVELEQAISIRRWYVGVSEQIALGTPQKGPFLVVAGNPEVWGRALWASRAGLAYGGGLGLVLPAVSHGSAGTEVAQTIRVLRPWDYVDFAGAGFILRPFVDVRDIDGPVILQLRQGIDWNRSTGALTSRTTLYVGYRPAEALGLGFEAWEVYLIQAPLRGDEGRAAYAVSPSVRLMTRTIKPALSLLVPIDRPLFDAVDGFWAVRLSFDLTLDGASER